MAGTDQTEGFAQGVKDARETSNLADQQTSAELLAIEGFDPAGARAEVLASDFNRGWDYAILHARKHGVS
ncbi:MAG: hypothetical protein WBA67_16710 [Jannaschia sp.]